MDRPQRRLVVNDVMDALDCDESDWSSEVDDSDADEDYVQPVNDQESTDEEATPDSAPDSDDEPLSSLVRQPAAPPHTANQYRWRKADFEPHSFGFTGDEVRPSVESNVAVDTPLEYFQKFITMPMLHHLVEQTNIYSVQKYGRCVQTTLKEIEQLLGIYLQMGLCPMTSMRAFWQSGTRYPPVADVMSRDRFLSLIRSLHVVNNMDVAEEEKGDDRLWKVRPWLEKLRQQCIQVEPEEMNSIDEMMVPYKGTRSPVQQYMRGKPHPWGFKIWARTSVGGIVLDFDVYQGSSSQANGENGLGVAGNVVVKLCEHLPREKNYKIFADNFFSSVPLVIRLKEMGIHYVGTVRANRLKGCILEEEKSMKKRGRGVMDHKVERENNIIALRWHDTRAVTLISSFAGREPIDEVKRWNKKQKQHIMVQRPYIIKCYNKCMGGIDLVDACMARFKYPVKSRRWYIYLFWHSIMIALVNAWMLYRRDATLLGIAKNEQLSQRQFQSQVASALIHVRTARPGRPSLLELGPGSYKPPRKIHCTPVDDVRYDQTAHWPLKIEKRGRCKVCVTNQTDTSCEKCQVRLCFNEKRNCFRHYHLQ